MKDLALLGALGLGAYLLMTKKAGAEPVESNVMPAFTPIPAGTVTPAGNLITKDVSTVKDGIDYINQTYFPKQTTRVVRTQAASLVDAKLKANALAMLKKPKSAAGNPAPWNRKYGGRK